MLRVARAEHAAVEVWTLDRPHAANALDAATVGGLERAVAALAGSDVRCVVLRGATRDKGRPVFAAGADLRELAAVADAGTARAFAERMIALFLAFEALPLPVVAAVDGDVLGGGCELLTACDVVVAARTARFSFRQARMGVGTGWGGATRLVRRVGLGAARRLLFSGMDFDAEEALRVGLVDELADAALPRALALAGEIAANSRAAVAALKADLHDAMTLPTEASYAREVERFVETWAGPDHRAALAKLVR